MKLNKKIWNSETEFIKYMGIYLNTFDRRYRNCTLKMGISKWSSLASTYKANKARYISMKSESKPVKPIKIENKPKKTFIKDGRVIHKLYIKSDKRKIKRAKAFVRCGKKCECCNLEFPAKKLNLHHHSYERLGSEKDSDLAVVCINCHHKIHFENGKAVPLDEKTLRSRYRSVKGYL